MNYPSIATGVLSHTRKGYHKRSFQYSHTMLMVDLTKIQKARQLPWPLQYNRNGMISIRDRDYIDASSQHVYDKLESIVSNSSSRIVTGDRVLLLTTPAVLGYCFNPAVFYFICDTNESIKGVVVEVHNTFGESHVYCLSRETLINNNSSYKANKEFHVSPFLDRSGHYEFRFKLSEYVADISILLHQEGQQIMTTRFIGNLIPLTTSNLLKSFPGIAISVLLTEFRILRQAYKLFFKKKTPFYEKPDPLKDTTISPSKGYISRLKIPFS
jgi:cyclopropane-fatty-acyl-phospholipid synthase